MFKPLTYKQNSGNGALMPPKRLLKRAGSNRVIAGLAAVLIRTYIRLVHKTSRWRHIGREHIDPLLDSRRGVILAFWHQRLLMAAAIRSETDARVFMLISAHRDGEIIASAVRPFGVELIRGSTAHPRKTGKSKGGAPAIAQMAAALKDGGVVGMTPDGPRGPRGRAQMGVVRLARLSGAPIVPAAFSTSGGRFLGTWDRFLLAAPFSRGAYVVGPPVFVPPDAEGEALEKYRATVERALNDAASEADRAVGRSPAAAGLGNIA